MILIEIDGRFTGAGGFAPSTGDGLVLSGGNTTIRGLAIDGFSAGAAVALLGLGGDTIAGDFLGIDATGTVATPDRIGVQVETTNNTIGGTTPADRDVASGNMISGVDLTGASATGNSVEGDFVGTNAAGAASLSVPAGDGVDIDSGASANTIGGTTAGALNVISGNDGSGVLIAGAATIDNVVQGNLIGTDATRAFNLGNGADGVTVSRSAMSNTVGGATPGAGNTIVFNVLDGVNILSGAGNAILSNVIFRNQGLGIDLGGDGVTPNTPGSPHTGPNDRLNFPVLTTATTTASGTVIIGTLGAAPGTAFTVQFFGDPSTDPSGHGQGKVLLGQVTNVVTNTDGFAGFTASLPIGFPPGQFVTATATDPAGNTSEFSQDVEVAAAATADLQLSISPATPSPGLTGLPYSYNVTVTNAGPQDASNVVVDEITDSGAKLRAVNTDGKITEISPGQDNISFAKLAAGASVTVAIEIVADHPGTFTDTASVTADQADPNPKDNTATVTETVIAQSSDLQLGISPATPSPGVTGLPYSYNVTVTNAGPQDASNVVIDEITDSGAKLHAVNTDGTITEISPTQDNISFAKLAAGASVTIAIEVVADHPGTFTDTASVTADQADPNPKDNTAAVTETVIAQSSDLQLSISPATPSPGLTGVPYSYNVTVTNAGPQDASNVVVVEITDSGAKLHAVNTDGTITEISPTQDNISFAKLAVGASVTIAIEVVADHPGTFTDTASVTADQADPNPKDNTATVTETVVAPKRTPPAAPINVFASLMKTGKGTFAPFVTWGIPDGSADVPTFLLYRSTISNGEGALPYRSPVSAHHLVDVVGKPGTTYYYEVSELSGSAPGPRSAEAKVTIPGLAALTSRAKLPAGPATKFSRVNFGPVPTHKPSVRTHPVKSAVGHTPSVHVARQRTTARVRPRHS